MKKLLKASALALAMSLVLFGCANSTNTPTTPPKDDSITTPTVNAVDTSTIKPVEAPLGKKSITTDKELKDEISTIAKSVVQTFSVDGPLLADLQKLVMDTTTEPSFYNDVITKFLTKNEPVNLNLADKTYTSKFGTIKINTANVDYELNDKDGTKITISGNADANALVNIAKAVQECSVKAAAANVKAVAKDFVLQFPNTNTGNPSASGAIAAAASASAYFDDTAYAGFVNANVALAIPDVNKYVEKAEKLQSKVDPIFEAIFPPKKDTYKPGQVPPSAETDTSTPETDSSTTDKTPSFVPPTEKQLNELAGYLDQLPITFTVKLTITDVNGGNEYVVANATKFSELIEVYKRFGPMTETPAN